MQYPFEPQAPSGDSTLVLQYKDTPVEIVAETLIRENYAEALRFAAFSLQTNAGQAAETARLALAQAVQQRQQYQGQVGPLAWILRFVRLSASGMQMASPLALRQEQNTHRLAIYLRYAAQLNNHETAYVLGLAENAARKVLEAARSALAGCPVPPPGREHRRAVEAIRLVLDGELTDAQRNNLEKHFQQCTVCPQFASELEAWERNLHNTLRTQLPQPPVSPEEQAAAVQAALNTEISLPAAPANRLYLLWVAAILGLIIAGSAFFISLAGSEPTRNAGQSTELSTLLTQSAVYWETDISVDGRYIVFTSASPTLVPEDTNAVSDVFLLDRRAQTIRRLSITNTGEEANGPSYAPSISADGRWVVFTSHAENLEGESVPICNSAIQPGRHCSSIYLVNTQTQTVERISQPLNAEEGATGDSFYGVITPDGSQVVFWSAARSLTPEDTAICGGTLGRHNCLDLFIFTRASNALLRVPVERPWRAEQAAYTLDTSLGGEFILLNLYANDGIAANLNLENSQDLYIYNQGFGVFEAVNLNAAGEPGNQPALNGAISHDGQFVVFASQASNLSTLATNGAANIFLRNRLENQTTLVTIDANGQPGNRNSGLALSEAAARGAQLDISPDGNFILFTSQATNLQRAEPPWWCAPAAFTTFFCSNLYRYDRAQATLTRLNPEVSPNARYLFTRISNGGESALFIETSLDCLETCTELTLWQAQTGAERLLLNTP